MGKGMKTADLLAKIDNSEDREAVLREMLHTAWIEGLHAGVRLSPSATVRTVSDAIKSGPYNSNTK